MPCWMKYHGYAFFSHLVGLGMVVGWWNDCLLSNLTPSIRKGGEMSP